LCGHRQKARAEQTDKYCGREDALEHALQIRGRGALHRGHRIVPAFVSF
jgi:hypothetical protein